jgi:hypothetical protein
VLDGYAERDQTEEQANERRYVNKMKTSPPAQNSIHLPAAESFLRGETGVSMVEYILFTSIVIIMVVGVVIWAQQRSEERLDTGRSLFQCEQLCDPQAGDCSC